MDFLIELPFCEVVFKGAQERHKEYFKSLFFSGKKNYLKPKYKISVQFENVRVDTLKSLFLEEDTMAKNGSLFMLDTRKNKVEINFDLFKDNHLSIKVDPDFDLYFLYNTVIEPLLIIWAAKYGILYVHSSAIANKDGAYVFPAWRHTGKTSSIFSLAREKISFMGDDFCVLKDSMVYLYPKHINIFSYNFESYPWLYKKLPLSLSLRIKLSVYLKKILFWISQNLSGALSKVFYRLSELAEISTNTKVTPFQLGLKTKDVAPLTRVRFITKAGVASGEKKLTLSEIKQKLLAVTVYEIREFLDIYQKYKYLYPKQSNTVIESFDENFAGAVEKNLRQAFETHIALLPNKDAYYDKSTQI